MNWFFGLVLLIIALALVATSAFLLVGREQSWRMIAGDPDLGPFDLTAPQRASRPNDALLCTPGLCSAVKTDGDLPVYAMTPEALIAALTAAIEAQPERKERVDDGADPNALRYVTWTETMRFPDTNQFLAVDRGDGTSGLVAYARAQVGYSDQGNNRARLTRWTGAID
ncbi:MAG: DUF1499 domain-containing protein [Roseitalea sp.]|jgi:hypothetical protein|nr:DUF1499 domain-containing protein [Roseitalea sp.]MBO6722274.1 DUF1499 domain-containing protein [Roseitalea sp.]MBO6742397.1 DUF1499 domain-containing protein [Roseitalea sp.]